MKRVSKSLLASHRVTTKHCNISDLKFHASIIDSSSVDPCKNQTAMKSTREKSARRRSPPAVEGGFPSLTTSEFHGSITRHQEEAGETGEAGEAGLWRAL